MTTDSGDELNADLCAELLALRSHKGSLTLASFARHPKLVQICGESDALDGFLIFRAELERWARGTRGEAAYAWSVLSPEDSVLDRLSAAAEHIPGGFGADQRTVRRWGDRAVPDLVLQLVIQAEAAGRRGRTLLSIEVGGGLEQGLDLTVDLMTPADLSARAPHVSLWRFTSDSEPVEAEIDLVEHPSVEVVSGDYTMGRFRLHIDVAGWAAQIPWARNEDTETRILQIDMHVPESPSVSTRFIDRSSMPEGVDVEFMGHRGGCQVALHAKRNVSLEAEPTTSDSGPCERDRSAS